MGSIFLIKLPPEEVLSDEVVVPSPSSSSAALDQLHDEERTPLIPSEQQQRDEEPEPNIGGWELFQNTDGLSISFIAFLLAGVGLMYVNNVGAIIKTLYLSSDPHEDEVQNFQNLHVALLSVFSCLGRISIGGLSDLAKYKLNIERLWFLLLACIYTFFGHILVGFFIKDLNHLWMGTILIGFGYGNTFGICPTITAEWFGAKRFGVNW